MLVIQFFGHDAWAAFELSASGPRAIAMGGAGVVLTGDAAGIFRNPALTACGLAGAGFTWSQQFGLPELSREAVCAGLPVRHQPLSVRAGTLGNEVYRESDFGLSLARSIRPEIAVGLEVGGRWLDIRGYPTAGAFAVTAGLLAKPVRGLAIGAVWSNLNAPRLSGYRDRLLESLTVGLAAEVTRTAVLAADLVQEKAFPVEYRFGAELRVLPQLTLRVGARAEPVRPSAGFQVDIGCWAFSYAGDLHPDLGASHEVGLEYRFRQ